MIDQRELDRNVVKRIGELGLFTRRFGSFSKSDYELVMFTAYLDSLEKTARDYELSVALGISETKVRNLRIKSQLVYPREIKWIDELAACITHGYYDRDSHSVTLTIEDPSVQNLIRNKIEENFGVVGKSLNSKQLILSIESLLLLATIEEKNQEEIISNLNNKLRKETNLLYTIEKKDIKSKFLDKIPDLVSFIGSVASIYSVGAPIISALVSKL